jgi:hypothetical protein
MQECQNVWLILALLCLADIVHNHVSDFLHAVRLLRKVLSEGGSSDFRQMLMLRDCENLFLGQPGQRHAIFQADHKVASQNSIAGALFGRPYFPRAWFFQAEKTKSSRSAGLKFVGASAAKRTLASCCAFSVMGAVEPLGRVPSR